LVDRFGGYSFFMIDRFISDQRMRQQMTPWLWLHIYIMQKQIAEPINKYWIKDWTNKRLNLWNGCVYIYRERDTYLYRQIDKRKKVRHMSKYSSIRSPRLYLCLCVPLWTPTLLWSKHDWIDKPNLESVTQESWPQLLQISTNTHKFPPPLYKQLLRRSNKIRWAFAKTDGLGENKILCARWHLQAKSLAHFVPERAPPGLGIHP
jgi:hypothetical protein